MMEYDMREPTVHLYDDGSLRVFADGHEAVTVRFTPGGLVWLAREALRVAQHMDRTATKP